MEEVKPDIKAEKKLEKTFARSTPNEQMKALVMSESLPADGLWAYASVEVVDTAGDVVVIDGIETETYHNPPSSYMKITAQHDMELADGTPPIIGRVERFLTTQMDVEGKLTPALAFYMTWAKDGNKAITPLAQKYKDLFDGGYMDSFSVGLIVTEYEDNDEGGLNLTQSSLYHIGAVTVPCNPLANVVKTIEQIKSEKKIQHLELTLGKLASQFDELVKQNNEAIKNNANEVDTKTSEIAKKLELITDRLDYVEAGVVTKSATVPKTGDRNRENAINELKSVRDMLRQFTGSR